MSAAEPVPARGAYPERVEAPDGPIQRWVSQSGWYLHKIFRRRLGDLAQFATDVEQHAARAADKPLAEQLSDLRYRLRRDGFLTDLVAECFGVYCVARAGCGDRWPTPEVLGAARQLVCGGIVDHAELAGRRQALAFAAAALAICGTRVHLLAASEYRALSIEAMLRESLARLGFDVACIRAGMAAQDRNKAFRAAVVCGTHREIAVAYLEDQLQLTGRPRLLLNVLAADSAHAAQRPNLLLDGLHFALVEEADLVMLDDAYAPVNISTEADQAQERLLYEQTLELASAFNPETDFTIDEQGVLLTDAGSERLFRLVAPLGGVWGARQRSEELVVVALFAIHCCERGVDYQVTQGRVVFPERAQENPDGDTPDPALVKLITLKEGCPLTGERQVLARISVPRFFRRYINLAGVCADARGIEDDFWRLYGLKARVAGTYPVRLPCSPRVFRTAAAKHAAVVELCLARATDGAAVVAVRTPGEAQALIGALTQAGLKVGLVRGLMDGQEQAVLASLDHAGGVAVTLFPAATSVARQRNGSTPLHLIVAELHDSNRHICHIESAFAADSCELLLSIDEKEVETSIRAFGAGISLLTDKTTDELTAKQSRWIAGRAQREAERGRVLMRLDLILRDDYMTGLLAFSGRRD